MAQATKSATKTAAPKAQSEEQTTERKLGVAQDYGSVSSIQAFGTTNDGRTLVTALLWPSGKAAANTWADLPPTRFVAVGEQADELLTFIDRKFVELQVEGYWEAGDQRLDSYVKFTTKDNGRKRCNTRLLHATSFSVLNPGQVKELSDAAPQQEELQF